MQIRRVRDEESEIDRYVEECWFRYHDDLSEVVPGHSLVEDVDREDVVDHLRETLDSPSDWLWVALDGAGDPTAPLSAVDATFAGFVRTSLEPTPPAFEWPPDRIRIEDIWVEDSYRGSGLADDLVGRARRQARENGCRRLDLVVGVDNDRAVAYFERLGFETLNYEMHVPVEALRLDLEGGEGEREGEGEGEGEREGERAFGDGSSLRLRRVRAEDDVVSRFVEECWEPFWRALEAADGRERLSQDRDPAAVADVLLENLDRPDQRAWVALDDAEDPTAGLAAVEATFAGWLGAGLAPADRFLDPPERLFVGNLYVDPEYRGEGLADRIMERAVQYAREEGCVEFELDVGADNERARAYYEKLGFEPFERRLSVDVDEIEL